MRNAVQEWTLAMRGTAALARQGRLVGGKAAGLARLLAADFPVPPFYVITTEALGEVLRAEDAADAIARLSAALRDGDEPTSAHAAQEMREIIAKLDFPPECERAIRQLHADVIGPAAPAAVRSSARGEDGAEGSFAGMYDSELNVAGAESLRSAIKRVWASAASERALAYRRKLELRPAPAAMAVIVQQMVDARWSGLMFTGDPLDEGASHAVIHATAGSGEALVQGHVDAAGFRVDRATLEITPEPATAEPAWSPPLAELRKIAATGLAIERLLGGPQDIEFSFDAAGELAILQARPIARLAAAAGESHAARETHRQIWDNSNIIESYPGVTSPLTFSFIRRVYAIVYRSFAEVMGVRPAAVRRHAEAFDNMLGLFHGRVYYNLGNWHRLVQLFPGYQYNREFMESMMGVKEPLRLGAARREAGFWRRWFVELPALLNLVRRSTWNFLRIRRLASRFEREFDARYGAWSRIDFDALAPDEILAHYRRMEAEMLARWKTPIINDFFVMVLYGLLRKLCAAWCGDDSGALQNGLLCGVGQVASAEPARRILRLAKRAHDEPALARLMAESSLDELPARVAGDHRYAAFAREFDDFLEQYGLRSVEELKLESQSFRDRPELVYQLIRNYLELGDERLFDLDARQAAERRMRDEAERRALQKIGESRGGWLRRRIFRTVLAGARLGVRNRESMRLARTKIFGLFRTMLRSIGASFQRQGILSDARDIYFLTVDEVWDYIRGAAATTDLKALVELRRQEYAQHGAASAALSNRFETCGTACRKGAVRLRPSPSAAATGSLRGVGCCPGIVTGTVQVVADPRTAKFEGDILVAEHTDPGWTPLYLGFSGVLVERGSVLSHSMIVAREFGVPTIVGVAGLTARLRTGQRVRMDGRAGTIEILTPGDDAPAGQRRADWAVAPAR